MKKLLWQLHSWLGLLCGVGLVVVGLSGSFLVVEDEFDAWRRPEVYRATPTPAGRLSLDALFNAAQRALPGWTINDWDVLTDPGFTDRFRAFPPHDSKEICIGRIDPYTGELRGVPATYPHTLGGWLLILHTSFFGGTAGAAVVGLLGTGLLLLGVSGVWLYRGFWKSFFTLRWGRSARIFFSDLHKMAGISSVAFNLAVGFTGVWWTSERVYGSLTESEQADVAPPGMSPSAPLVLSRANVSLDALVAEAGRRLPGFRLSNLSLPDKPEGEITLLGSVPSANPLRSSYANRVRFVVPGGELKEVTDIRRAGVGAQLYDMFIPLHYGTFGGWPVKLLWCLGGMTPAALAASGLAIWTIRRKSAKRRGAVLPTPTG